MEKLRDIDFWDSDYDLNIAFHIKGQSAHLSLSKKDKSEPVERAEIINALALGIIGLGNIEDVRHEYIIKDILDRCDKIGESDERD